MTEKIGLIKNPLTIIAIFAGIAEVSGTIVLPFIAEANQRLFIVFLIIFPSILVILFFVTLNFNNKVLYAPSDYKDEDNYIKINKYDIARQQLIEVKVPTAEVNGNENLIQFERPKRSTNRTFNIQKPLYIKKRVYKKNDTTTVTSLTIPDIDTKDYELLVTKYDNADEFVFYMKMFNIDFKVYDSVGDHHDINYSNSEAIWLGNEINLEAAQFLIKESKSYYPHLKYIMLTDNSSFTSEEKQFYIGGSTETAVKRGTYPLKDLFFEQLQSFTDLKSFHDYINEYGHQ